MGFLAMSGKLPLPVHHLSYGLSDSNDILLLLSYIDKG